MENLALEATAKLKAYMGQGPGCKAAANREPMAVGG